MTMVPRRQLHYHFPTIPANSLAPHLAAEGAISPESM